MDGFQRRREQKKRQILQTAYTLFSQNGFQKVSIAEVAKQARVSQVTIYNYFESKYDLFREAVIWYMALKTEEYRFIFEEQKPFEEKIEALIFDKTKEAAALHQSFIETIMLQDTELKKRIDAFETDVAVPFLINIIEQGRREGYVKKDLSNETIVYYISLLSSSLSQPAMLTKLNPVTSKELLEIFFYGLLGKR